MPRTPSEMTAIRIARRAAGCCSECGASLAHLLAWTFPQCPECKEAQRERTARYRADHRDRFRASRRRSYRRRAAARICVECQQPAAPGRRRCERHLGEHRESDARYLDRKEIARAA